MASIEDHLKHVASFWYKFYILLLVKSIIALITPDICFDEAAKIWHQLFDSLWSEGCGGHG